MVGGLAGSMLGGARTNGSTATTRSPLAMRCRYGVRERLRGGMDSGGAEQGGADGNADAGCGRNP